MGLAVWRCGALLCAAATLVACGDAAAPGAAARELLVGGALATPGSPEVPSWAASLVSASGGALCTGSLVDKRWVLTGIDCPFSNVTTAVLGKRSLAERNSNTTASLRVVKAVALQHSPKNQPSRQADQLVMLMLEADVPAQVSAPAALGNLVSTQSFSVAGWSAPDGVRANDAALRLVTPLAIAKFTLGTCNQLQPSFSFDNDIHRCLEFSNASVPELNLTCSGDVGAPMFVASNPSALVAVATKARRGCGGDRLTGYFTSVTTFANAIADVVAANPAAPVVPAPSAAAPSSPAPSAAASVAAPAAAGPSVNDIIIYSSIGAGVLFTLAGLSFVRRLTGTKSSGSAVKPVSRPAGPVGSGKQLAWEVGPAEVVVPAASGVSGASSMEGIYGLSRGAASDSRRAPGDGFLLPDSRRNLDAGLQFAQSFGRSLHRGTKHLMAQARSSATWGSSGGGTANTSRFSAGFNTSRFSAGFAAFRRQPSAQPNEPAAIMNSRISKLI